MLNYTSKIQHFLNLHRKHTKYIVVLLLLSAFVASFVCSALTEPAVSMTNQSFDITTNLSVDSDGATQDGLPIIDESYSSGQFSGYMNEAAPLGIATRFGLFAFESVDIIAHCNTNLATPNATIGAPFGSSQIAAEGGQEITLITDSLSIGDITSNNTVLLFPESVNFVDEQDNFVSINPLPRVKINNGETKHINQGSTKMYAYHVRKEAFINWTEEKNNYIERQNDWINKNGTADNYSIYVKAWYDENDENNKTISRIEIPNEGEYYLYIPYNKLPNGSRELNITLGKNVTLIINVDLSGAGETYDANFQITGSQGGLNFTNESSALENGMNLLWNFYDSSGNQNNQYTGTINMVKPGVGCIVAPSANVNIDASFAGTIVANKIKTSATFSKSMFKTVVIAEETDIAVMAHKEWDDGKENHTNDSVTVQLYKSLSPNASLNDLKDSDKEGDPRILNADNNWNDTWFGLDRSYYYYVKEIEAKGNDGTAYTCNTEYENNARNTTGTVKVKNTIKTIDQNEKLRLTVKMYWSDNAALHPETEVDFGNGNKENLKRKWVDLYRTTEPKQLNELKSADTDSNNNVTNWNDQCEDLRGFFIYEKGEKQDDEIKQPWQYTTKELPVVDSNNNLYYYYVVFNHNSDGTYMFEYSNNGVSGKSDTITVGAIKMLQLTVNKNWEDDNNTSDNGEVAYKVYQSRTKADYRPSDAKEIAEIKSGSNNLSFNLNNSNNWKASIGRSPQLPQSTIYGEKYYYYVEETSISGSELNKYNISYTNNGFNDDADVTITNQKKEDDKFSIKVVKNKPNALKAATTVVLYRSTIDGNWDNAEKVGTQPLSESNNWQCVFTALDTKDNNNSNYYYKVVEEKPSPGFNVSYSPQVINTSDITQNVQKQVDIYYNEKNVTINVKKMWDNINPGLIKHVVVNVYRYKGDINAQAIGNYLSSNSDFTFLNNYNVLDDSSTPTLSGSTATYTGLTFTDNKVSVDLSQFSGKILNAVDIKFDNINGIYNNTNFITEYISKITCGALENPQYNLDKNDIINNNFATTWQTDGTIRISALSRNIGDANEFVVIAQKDMSSYPIASITFTFNETVDGNNGENTGGSTGGTITKTDTVFPTGSLNGNVLSFNSMGYNNSKEANTKCYSTHDFNFVYDLSAYKDRQIQKIEFKFNTDMSFGQGTTEGNYFVLYSKAEYLPSNHGNFDLLKQENDIKGVYNTNDKTYTISNLSLVVENTDLLLFTCKDKPSFQIQLTITFADSNNNQNQNQITFPGYWWNGEKTELNFNGLSSVNDTNAQYSDNSSKYNYVYKLPSDAYGKQITKIEYTFNNDLGLYNGKEYRIICGTQDKLKDPSNALLVKIIKSDTIGNQGISYSNNLLTYVVVNDTEWYGKDGNDRLGALSSSEDSYLVFATSDTNNAPTFQITNLKITFASDEGNDEEELTDVNVKIDIKDYMVYEINYFKTKKILKVEAYFHKRDTFSEDDDSFKNKIFTVDVSNPWLNPDSSKSGWNNNVLTQNYESSQCKNIQHLQINCPSQYTQNLEKIIVYYEDDLELTIENNFYNSNNLATGSGNQGGNTEKLEYSETINVLSTNLNADGNLDYSKSLAWQIPEQFRGFTVQEIKAEFHNRNKLTREGTEYYNTVFNMNIYAINDNQLYENWKDEIDGKNVSEYKSSFNDPYIYKRYLPKSYNNYSELDFLLICTAYTENLKEIVITFEGGHTITLTNGNAGTNIEEPLPYNPYDITLVETITLTAGDNWEHILYNQPMVAPDGTPYYYVIEEIEIEYKDGTKLSSAISISNLFEVESTILNALDLEENPENNVLTVTNKLKTTNTTMPSTGGIGTHPYRNAGILMMICSGGIYISLRALRKKQN